MGHPKKEKIVFKPVVFGGELLLSGMVDIKQYMTPSPRKSDVWSLNHLPQW